MNIFSFNPFDVKPVTFPDLFTMIGDLISMLLGLIADLVNGLQSMLYGISIVTDIIDNMITGIQNDNIEGIPVLEAIGVYRYLVGDVVFYLTYLMLLFGVCFTIIKLVLLIKSVWSKSMSISGGGFFNMVFGKLPFIRN